MAKGILSLRCPTCDRLVLRSDPDFPFCSERCRLIDLGKWASGRYVISTPMNQGDATGDADYTVNARRRVSGAKPDGESNDK